MRASLTFFILLLALSTLITSIPMLAQSNDAESPSMVRAQMRHPKAISEGSKNDMPPGLADEPLNPGLWARHPAISRDHQFKPFIMIF